MAITVQLRAEQPHLAYGEALDLEYEVFNDSLGDIFLVQERPLVRVRDGRVEVIQAEQPVPKHLSYFDYHPPQLVRVPAGGRQAVRLALAMPPRRVRVGEHGWQAETTPVQGPVQLILTLGYTSEPMTPSWTSDPTGDPLTAFLKRQQTISSAPQTITVAGPQAVAAPSPVSA